MAAGPPPIQECLSQLFFFFRLPSSSANSALRRRRRRWASSRAVSIRSASALASRAISSNSFEIFTISRKYSFCSSKYEQCCTSRPISQTENQQQRPEPAITSQGYSVQFRGSRAPVALRVSDQNRIGLSF